MERPWLTTLSLFLDDSHAEGGGLGTSVPKISGLRNKNDDSRSVEGEPVAAVDNNRRDGTIYSCNEAKVVVDENRRNGTIYSRSHAHGGRREGLALVLKSNLPNPKGDP
jgi:hypothetical protein